MNTTKQRKKWDPRNYYFGPGQIFDSDSYIGNFRSIVFSCLVMYVGWHLDEAGRWLWHQFGEVLVVSPAKERWHRMVTVALCSVGIILGLLNMHRIFLRRRNKVKEAEIEKLRQFHDLNKTK